jgi:hypothetical protein
VLISAGAVWAGNESLPGELEPELPTLHCLGFRWLIAGDDNGNVAVSLRYRRAGESDWRAAMPLFRVESAAMKERKPPDGVTIHAGSIFNLTPDTAYEVELELRDADGGGETRQLAVRTWKEPEPPAPTRTLHVAPPDASGKPASTTGTGSEQDPFRSIAAADAQAKPGDLMLLHAGVYPGPLSFTKSGSEEAPILWRAAGDGEVVIEGPEDGRAVSASHLQHVFFEGLTIRNATGGMNLTNSSCVTVRRCRFLRVHSGVQADGQQEHLFISDNVFEGLCRWGEKPPGEDRAIELSGVGHVVAYNRISGFKDGIDTRPPYPVRAIDIHNNDIAECVDDGIELDYSEQNTRAYQNRLTNCAMGISFQPVRGGPAYAVANVLYNIGLESFKLHLSPPGPGRMTSGGVILHNTVVKTSVPVRVWSNEGPAHHYYLRNNLLVGGEAPYAIELTCPIEGSDWDCDAYVGGPFGKFARWNSKTYASLDEFQAGTGEEKHGLVLPWSDDLFASGVARPTDLGEQYQTGVNDLRLGPRSPAIDRGVALPSVNDGYRGQAPDLGAVEEGDPLPHYGPRTE